MLVTIALIILLFAILVKEDNSNRKTYVTNVRTQGRADFKGYFRYIVGRGNCELFSVNLS